MSLTPFGMSIQNAYNRYRKGEFIVNRKYQRKLVWTIQEKQDLVSSILNGYPIPLILLANVQGKGDAKRVEIIDGMQRLNAIFSFIENAYDFDGKYFDVDEFLSAKEFATLKAFTPVGENLPKLSRKQCGDILDYQLAVTEYSTDSKDAITEVFGRINSGGKQLSDQERRQAGVVTTFAEMVRRLAAELRGDASEEIVNLFDMPAISIESRRTRQGYGLKAEETFWVKQGILSANELRDSEDEELLADICASILFGEPFAVSQENLNRIYDADDGKAKELDLLLTSYKTEKLAEQVKSTISVLIETVEAVQQTTYFLRNVVRGNDGKSPIKAPFYAISMAFFDLIVNQNKKPIDQKGLVNSLNDLASKLVKGAHYVKTEDRVTNIDVVKGLISKFFVTADPPLLGHGSALAVDLENSLRRSAHETSRYELKQGILRLSGNRQIDPEFSVKLPQHICAIANSSPGSIGYLYVGVSDKDHDATRILELDGVAGIKPAGCTNSVVGIDREAKILGITVENYASKVLAFVRSSELSEPLKTSVLTSFDSVIYRSMTVLRFAIKGQEEVSTLGNKVYFRDGASTVEADGVKVIALSRAFANHKMTLDN